MASDAAFANFCKVPSKPPNKTSCSDFPAADFAFSIAFNVFCNNCGNSFSGASVGVKFTTTFSPNVYSSRSAY